MFEKKNWLDNDEISGPLMGMAAAINCIAEALAAKGVIDPSFLRQALQMKIDELRSELPTDANADAQSMLEYIQRRLTDPARAQNREMARKLLSEPPQGRG